jgi:hypothetical protein
VETPIDGDDLAEDIASAARIVCCCLRDDGEACGQCLVGVFRIVTHLVVLRGWGPINANNNQPPRVRSLRDEDYRR